MKDAELAVRVAEQPQTDAEIGNYNVYMADRKVDIAVAQAETALAEDQRVGLAQQRDKARLAARTRPRTSRRASLRAPASRLRIKRAKRRPPGRRRRRATGRATVRATGRATVGATGRGTAATAR